MTMWNCSTRCGLLRESVADNNFEDFVCTDNEVEISEILSVDVLSKTMLHVTKKGMKKSKSLDQSPPTRDEKPSQTCM